MILPPRYIESDYSAREERLLDNLDTALDLLALAIFNIGYKLRSPRISNLNLYIPTADKLLGLR